MANFLILWKFLTILLERGGGRAFSETYGVVLFVLCLEYLVGDRFLGFPMFFLRKILIPVVLSGEEGFGVV